MRLKRGVAAPEAAGPPGGWAGAGMLVGTVSVAIKLFCQIDTIAGAICVWRLVFLAGNWKTKLAWAARVSVRRCEKLKSAKTRLRKLLITNGRIFRFGSFCQFFHTFSGLA
jgi:hypothetical protein